MNSRKVRMTVSLGMGMVLCGGVLVGRLATAQTPSSQASGGDLQRSAAIYNYRTAAASGPQRGEEIYYFKCWMCHNDYAIKAGTPAPPLKDLYKRPRLVTTGKPVNDETVSEVILNGRPGMPTYRYSLSDKDLADLLSYLRDEKCCFDGEEPPPNPWYRNP